MKSKQVFFLYFSGHLVVFLATSQLLTFAPVLRDKNAEFSV